MFNKVPEEKVLDYILTMFSMLDGRWLACERVSSFYHLLLFSAPLKAEDPNHNNDF